MNIIWYECQKSFFNILTEYTIAPGMLLHDVYQQLTFMFEFESHRLLCTSLLHNGRHMTQWNLNTWILANPLGVGSCVREQRRWTVFTRLSRRFGGDLPSGENSLDQTPSCSSALRWTSFLVRSSLKNCVCLHFYKLNARCWGWEAPNKCIVRTHLSHC